MFFISYTCTNCVKYSSLPYMQPAFIFFIFHQLSSETNCIAILLVLIFGFSHTGEPIPLYMYCIASQYLQVHLYVCTTHIQATHMIRPSVFPIPKDITCIEEGGDKRRGEKGGGGGGGKKEKRRKNNKMESQHGLPLTHTARTTTASSWHKCSCLAEVFKLMHETSIQPYQFTMVLRL